MQISARGRYALYILLDIAMNGDGAPVPISDISTRRGISQKYLEQIVSTLVHEGYLHSVRGAHGGYQLVGSPEDISLDDIMQSMEGNLQLVDCDGCPRSEGCLVSPLWRSIERSAHLMARSITLQSLIDGSRAHVTDQVADRPTVVIPVTAGCPMQRYTILDRSAGMIINVSGDTLEECFANAGYALFDQTADMAEVGSSREIEFTASGADDEDRLHAFLTELLSIRNCEGLVLKEFDLRFEGDEVRCLARGEVPELSAYRFGHEVRAIDHCIVDTDGDGASATVVFDL